MLNLGRRPFLVSALMLPAAAGLGAEQPKVVATFSVLGDMVRQIADGHVALTVIVGPGGDSESYEPTAADARSLADADLLVMNGLNEDFEPWLAPLIRQSGFHGTKLVASDGVKALRRADERPGAAGPQELDQHAWNDAANGAIYAANVAAALERLDPSNSAEYRVKAEAYGTRLRELDAWTKQQVAEVPKAKRTVITSHDAFGYLARAYDITMIAARGWTTEKEPSAQDVSRLIQQIRHDRIRAIFIENMNDPRLIQRIALEAGGTVGGELYSDALTSPGGDGDTYEKMFRHNILALKAGMLAN